MQNLYGWPAGTEAPPRFAVESRAVVGSTSTAYHVFSGVPARLAAGTRLVVQFKTANVGTVTLTWGANGPVSLRLGRSTPLATGHIEANQLVELQFDGTYFQMLTPPARPTARGRAAKFDGTTTSKTINNTPPSANTLTVTGHGLTLATSLNTAPCVALTTSSSLPGGGALTIDTLYYAFYVDANTLKFCTDPQGAIDGTTGLVTFPTTVGGGTNQLLYLTNCATRATLKYNEGIAGVVPRRSSTNGLYIVAWNPAFTGANSYVVMGAAKSGAANRGITLSVDPDDPASASLKWFTAVDQRAASNNLVDSTECHVMAWGT